MYRFRRILVFVDVSQGKSHALSCAVKLARLNGARLTVVDVVQEMPAFLAGLIGDLDAAYDQQHNDRLRGLTGWMRGEPIEATTKVLHGRPAFAMVREVLRGQHDLIIKDAHIEEGTEVLFGGVDQRLLRNCPCPVWLVKPGHDRPFERVLVAIDPQPTVEGEKMNARIMELASSMSEIEGSDLHVVSVWRGMNDPMFEVADWQIPNLQNEEFVETAARQTLDAVLVQSNVELPPSHIHFEPGSPGPAILHWATEVDADLIIMGTVARSGIPGLLIGNTAERVLRHVNCSVLSVKPDGFVSPITLDDEKPSDRVPPLNPA